MILAGVNGDDWLSARTIRAMYIRIGSPVQGKAIPLGEAKFGEILAFGIASNFASELPRIDISSQR